MDVIARTTKLLRHLHLCVGLWAGIEQDKLYPVDCDDCNSDEREVSFSVSAVSGWLSASVVCYPEHHEITVISVSLSSGSGHSYISVEKKPTSWRRPADYSSR